MLAPTAAAAVEDRPFWLEAEGVVAEEEDVAVEAKDVEVKDIVAEADIESVLGGKLVFVVISVDVVLGLAVAEGVYKVLILVCCLKMTGKVVYTFNEEKLSSSIIPSALNEKL